MSSELNCTYFISQVVQNVTNVNDICVKYDFSDVEDLKFFVNGTWYGGEYMDNITVKTGMNDTQLKAFYSTTNPDNSTNQTFGYWLAKTLADISEQMTCSDAANCSSRELAIKQWGQSTVTKNG